MAQPGDTIPLDHAERTRRQDRPEPTDADVTSHPGADRQRRPRTYRRGPVRVLAAVSLTTLTMGLLLPHGLLLAAGLVTAGAAAHLITSCRPPAPAVPDHDRSPPSGR